MQYIGSIRESIDNYIMHYGTPRHSGRYPWGSGEVPYQHEAWFDRYMELKSQGLSETEIAKGLGMSTTQLRAKRSIQKSEERAAKEAYARKLYFDDGITNYSEIGRKMGINESSVRSLLNPKLSENNNKTKFVADLLKKHVEEKDIIDIGPGVEYDLGTKSTRLKTAVAMLKEEGYEVHYIRVEQMGTGKKTTVTVLTKPGITSKYIYDNMDKIHNITEVINDDGLSSRGIKRPVSIDSSRLKVVYAEEGGSAKDGVIELRRGVEDISLGNSQYAQVRIAVDDTHYIKGMAMYSDNMPDGVDIIFNTSKHKGTPIKGDKDNSVLKPLKKNPRTGEIDWENPFGATIDSAKGQRNYIDEDGNSKLSPINKVNDEGDWSEWSKTLASQMLSKQVPQLAKRQLYLSYAEKADQFDEIKKLTNPAVKKLLLESFADDCDSSSVHLKAAALPRQSSHVILPISNIKENEVYAPNYRNGEEVVLIRYPHGGTFEIPRLIVNNKNEEANRVMHNAVDAIGINSKVAERLSGADFDGDTVLVIPTKGVKINSTPALEGLKEFDPKESYPGYPGMPKMKSQTKQNEMGRITNLITDMTLKGANEEELTRAVKHSMVVIDAEKHNLDYKRSFVEQGIAELKEKYQFNPETGKVGGSSTLISRAKSETHIPQREERYKIDPKTGKKVFKPTNETYIKTKTYKNGTVSQKVVPRLQESTQMEDTDDAFTLSSGTRMEKVYATYANQMKNLANRARLEYLRTPSVEYSPSARKAYAPEVESLNAQLIIALKNAPRERKAQLMANVTLANAKKDNPDMDKETTKKIKNQALAAARIRYGAKKQPIKISDREWEAIQAGAVSQTTLMKILRNTDLDDIKKRATPRSEREISATKQSRIKAMFASGYSTNEIADALGISTSTVNNVLHPKQKN